MTKVAIFVEGQSELIFLRYFLPLRLGWEKISFRCVNLYADEMRGSPYEHPNPYAEVHFLIVNVANDEKVLSAVKDREKYLIQHGYEKIIGLRDMYSEEYRKKAGDIINDRIITQFINAFQETIEKMSEPDKVKMCFAIMELEAWFLGVYNIFERLDPVLTVVYIEERLGFNLSVIDPQTEFFKPADRVTDILGLVDRSYQKSKDDIESICSRIREEDFPKAFENGRCISFKNFCDELLN
ncbi:hypothetical protein KA005_82555 [bacterium]|nr:hypothetical protein [bacterium]